jgi:hypothetical protein
MAHIRRGKNARSDGNEQRQHRREQITPDHARTRYSTTHRLSPFNIPTDSLKRRAIAAARVSVRGDRGVTTGAASFAVFGGLTNNLCNRSSSCITRRYSANQTGIGSPVAQRDTAPAVTPNLRANSLCFHPNPSKALLNSSLFISYNPYIDKQLKYYHISIKAHVLFKYNAYY